MDGAEADVEVEEAEEVTETEVRVCCEGGIACICLVVAWLEPLC